MRSPRVLAAGLALTAAATLLVACGGASSPAAPTDPTLAQGQEIYNRSCASCHGRSGGGGLGPKLAGVVASHYPDIADQEAVIANGRSSMPAWKDKLSPEQITAVARYTREGLG